MRRSSRVKVTPLRLLADGLMILLLLYGTVFSFLSVFRPNVDTALVAAVLPVFGIAFLVIFSLPRYRWAILLPLAGIYGFFLWQTWSTLILGEVSLRCTVINFFAEDLSFVQIIRPIALLSKSGWRSANTLTLLTITAPLCALISLGVVRLRSFWLPFWCTFPIVLAPLIVTKIPDWLPLMALLACWSVLLTISLTGRRDPEGGARLTLIALPVIAAFLALLTFCLPSAGYRQPRWAADAQTKLERSLTNLRFDGLFPGGLLPGPFGGGGFMAAAGSEDVNLSAAGPLKYTGGTVLKVQSEVPGKTFLRGYSAALYTGTSWEPLPEEAYDAALPPLSSWMSPIDYGDANHDTTNEASTAPPEPYDGFQPLNFPALTAPNVDYHPITIENVAAPDGCVYFPYQLVTTPAQVAGAEFVNDTYLARDRNVRKHTLYYKPGALGSFQPLPSDVADAEYAYRAFVEQNYLDVPGRAGAALGDWYSLMLENPDSSFFNGIDTSGLEALPLSAQNALILGRQFAAMLAASTEYDPNTPITPAGEDFVSYFLNTSKIGYCMHYASAATLLFRMYNVPARYVSGYVTYIPASGSVNVADYAAHAWVEIYLDGYGWYPMDVTPGYSGGALPWVDSADTNPTPTPSAKPSSTPRPSTDPLARPSSTPTLAGTGSGGDPGFDLRLLWIPGMLLALLVIFILRRALAVGLRDRRFRAKDTNRAVLTAYRYLLRVQHWGGTVPQEAEDLAQKARFSQYSLTEEEREAMLTLTETQARKTDVILTGPKRLVYRYFFGLF